MDGETPGSIPNPEAKPVSADGTARATGWESRSPPNIHSWVAVIHARPATADAGHGRPPPSTLPPTTHTPRGRGGRDRWRTVADTIEPRGMRPRDPGTGPHARPCWIRGS